MNFFHDNAAVAQVHAASQFMDVVCQFAIPAGFLLIIALFILHLIDSISNHHHPAQPTPQTTSVASQPLNGQHTELTCNIDDAPLAGQHCQLTSPLAGVIQFKPQHDAVDYTQFTIRQLKQAASTWNQAHPQQKIQNLRKLTKSQLIEQLSQTAELVALEVVSNG